MLQKRSIDPAKLARYYKIQEKSSNEDSSIDQEIEEHICGGTLISDQWIISAKHCFEPRANIHLSKNPKDYMVVIGEHDIKAQDDGEFRAIEKIVPLSDANDLFADDIIMLKLKEPVEFNEYIRPACVASPSNDFGDDYLCQVAGWGHEKTKGTVQNTPRHITVPIISSYEKCVEEFMIPYEVDKIKPHNSTFCAGESGKDSCQYDSGGPLTCLDANNRQTLKGIVAWGLDCGSEYPGIYTNVPLFVRDINRIMRTE